MKAEQNKGVCQTSFAFVLVTPQDCKAEKKVITKQLFFYSVWHKVFSALQVKQPVTTAVAT